MKYLISKESGVAVSVENIKYLSIYSRAGRGYSLMCHFISSSDLPIVLGNYETRESATEALLNTVRMLEQTI